MVIYFQAKTYSPNPINQLLLLDELKRIDYLLEYFKCNSFIQIKFT